MSNAKKEKSTKTATRIPDSSCQEGLVLGTPKESSNSSSILGTRSSGVCEVPQAPSKTQQEGYTEALCGRSYRTRSAYGPWLPPTAANRRFLKLGRIFKQTKFRGTTDIVPPLSQRKDQTRK